MKPEHTEALLEILHASDATAEGRASLFGKDWIVIPGVFSPIFFSATEFTANNLPVREGQRVLEVGCGCGVFATLAALKGATHVVASDINPLAAKATKANVLLHGMDRIVDVRIGSVFDPLLPGETFDLVFWNAPYGDIDTTDLTMHERSIFDPGYQGISQFILEVGCHLNAGGRIFMGFSDFVGNVKLVDELLEQAGLGRQVVAEKVTDYGPGVGYVDFKLLEFVRRQSEICPA